MASQYSLILSAVRDLLETLPELAGGSVVIRKRPAYIPQVDGPLSSKTLVCVCPTTERLFDGVFSNEDHLDYAVQVAIVAESRLLLHEDGMLAMLDLRETIRQKLRTHVLSGTNVYDVVAYNPSPAFDKSGLDSLHDVSAQEFVFRTSEVRNQ